MADLKISQLGAISILTPATDVLPVVDSGGVTKKITTNQILGSGGTATLASATITGDLTVRTNKLAVTSTGVGIGTATLFGDLNIQNGSNCRLEVTSQAGGTTIENLNNARNAYLNLTMFADAYIWNRLGSTAMTLNATGLLVGTANNFASSRLCVQGTAGTSTPDVTIGIPVNSSGNTNLAIGRSASTNGYIFLDAYKAGVGGTELALNSVNGGSVLVGLSTVVAAGGCLQLKSGITFPATQVASSDANTLDDYEEGTFTPTIEGQSTAGIGVYSAQVGSYTKVGRLVTAHIFLTWSAHTGTGSMLIAGLPFAQANVANVYGSASFGYVDGIALTAGNILQAYVLTNNARLSCVQTPTGGGTISAVPLDTAGTIMLTVTYNV